jgi:hypothetical protein
MISRYDAATCYYMCIRATCYITLHACHMLHMIQDPYMLRYIYMPHAMPHCHAAIAIKPHAATPHCHMPHCRYVTLHATRATCFQYVADVTECHYWPLRCRYVMTCYMLPPHAWLQATCWRCARSMPPYATPHCHAAMMPHAATPHDAATRRHCHMPHAPHRYMLHAAMTSMP